METPNKWNFTKPKGNNSVYNCSIVPKFEVDLDIIMPNMYTKFHCNTCNLYEENERKLLDDRLTDPSKPICPPFFIGGHKNQYTCTFFFKEYKIKLKKFCCD